tara:strand:+ start:2048 stop:2242 length:195 start_codon:yes stop_codon:yes gene_type:complete
MGEKELKKLVNQQSNEINELNVVIDTLQTALRTTSNYLKDHPDYDSIFTTSAKWSLNYKRGEKI